MTYASIGPEALRGDASCPAAPADDFQPQASSQNPPGTETLRGLSLGELSLFLPKNARVTAFAQGLLAVAGQIHDLDTGVISIPY